MSKELTEREKLVAALDAAAEQLRVTASEWRRAYDALRDYDSVPEPGAVSP